MPKSENLLQVGSIHEVQKKRRNAPHLKQRFSACELNHSPEKEFRASQETQMRSMATVRAIHTFVSSVFHLVCLVK
jgi:hypothetical protein